MCYRFLWSRLEQVKFSWSSDEMLSTIGFKKIK